MACIITSKARSECIITSKARSECIITSKARSECKLILIRIDLKLIYSLY